MAKLGDVTDYLKHNSVQYEVIEHAPAFSAHEVAVVSHVPEKDLAKTLVVNSDGKYCMVVMPADHRLSDHLLNDVLKGKHIHLASEEDLQQLFPDCEVGAMPPFGNLYALPVYVATTLANDDVIVFNACSHTRSIRLKMYDYLRLVKPIVAEFSQSRFEIKEP
ncbi:MAG: YbaK/EbsC family protein [Ignavibacteriales bacterium]|nr:YbaK/EbsC family protein [Ignavibacteriales bacterium]